LTIGKGRITGGVPPATRIGGKSKGFPLFLCAVHFLVYIILKMYYTKNIRNERNFSMTNFTKNNFEYHGGYLHYNTGTERKFVARFKYRGPNTCSKSKFQTALIKHYTVEDYFAKMETDRAPLQILMDDGVLVFDMESRSFILDGKVL
jgi:hypothetical protein